MTNSRSKSDSEINAENNQSMAMIEIYSRKVDIEKITTKSTFQLSLELKPFSNILNNNERSRV
jgi:hypothetical protein